MNLQKKQNISTLRNFLILPAIFIFLLTGCESIFGPGKLTIEKAERYLTAHKWTLAKTYTHHGGNDILDPFETTDYHDLACESDDFWLFDENFEYEINLGSNRCEEDEDQVDDWGEWEVDFYDSEGDDLALYTYSDLPENIIPDLDFKIVELNKEKLIIQLGGCEDMTMPDEDGMCIEMTFEPF